MKNVSFSKRIARPVAFASMIIGVLAGCQKQDIAPVSPAQPQVDATAKLRPLCSALTGSKCGVKSATLISGSFCNNSAQVQVVYRWRVSETVGTGTVSYAFDVTAPLMGTYTGAAVLVASGMVDPTTAWKEFDVTVTMPGAMYQGSSTQNTVTGTGSCGGSPVAIARTCSLDFDTSYYTDNPARITATGDIGQVHVFTECSGICATPHVQCPSSGTFAYREVNSSLWTSVTLPTTGANISLPAGTYLYVCTLNYSFGSSQQSTGQFTVN